jgi:hypothetical protein
VAVHDTVLVAGLPDLEPDEFRGAHCGRLSSFRGPGELLLVRGWPSMRGSRYRTSTWCDEYGQTKSSTTAHNLLVSSVRFADDAERPVYAFDFAIEIPADGQLISLNFGVDRVTRLAHHSSCEHSQPQRKARFGRARDVLAIAINYRPNKQAGAGTPRGLISDAAFPFLECRVQLCHFFLR